MTIRYIENRYIIEDTFVIRDSKLDKHVCVCSTPEIAKHLTILLNEEPHDNGSMKGSSHDTSTTV